MKQRLTICFFAFIACATVGWGELLRVPSQHANITEAVSASMRGDTIVLATGHYHEVVPVPHSLTFASNWIFTHDSASIATTQWSPEDSLFTTVARHERLTLAGIRFLPIGDPRQGVRILRGDSLHAVFQACWFEGTFDSTANYGDSYIHSANGSRFVFEDCRFFGDWSGGRPYIQNFYGSIEIMRCSITGRAYRYPGFPTIYIRGDSTKISDSYFSFDSWGLSVDGTFEISGSHFYRTAVYSIINASQNQHQKVVRNCIFDSCRAGPGIPIIESNSISPFNIENCVFQNCYTASGNGFAIIDSYLNLRMRHVIFRNIGVMQRVIASSFTDIDSCRFENTPLVLTMNHGYPQDQVTIRNTDFVNCANFIAAGVPPNIDSLFVPDCYWGNASGPRHPWNPNGTGVMVPTWVNPFPFRTTPVFPQNEIGDPGHVTYSLPNSIELLPAYPNPFNNSTTIQFSLPQATDAMVAVFDITGRKVATLTNSRLTAGRSTLIWNPKQLSTGTYFVRLSTPNQQVTRPVTYLK
ncbi:MAG: T9SS type A sorting domain-containing protein [bacterium]|nr:T9SS type A sorting domain-containing protein [bacterium]